LNEGLLEYISTNIEKRKVKLDCSIPVYERLAAIYKYFKQKETAKHWDSVLTTAEKEFEEFVK
jgi:exonuclease VII small subunit